jgi:hypothetical protein
MIIFISILLILFFSKLFIINKNVYKNKVNKIIFYSSNDILYLLNDTFYYYYTNMNNDNLKLRRIKDKQQFLNNLYKYFYDINIYEKYILTNAISIAQTKLNKIKCKGFYPHKLDNIAWRIGFSNLYDYEFGLPHTHKDIIILNKDNIYNNNLVTILIHERIHVYQRLFPEDINEYLLYNKFEKVRKKTNNDRTNPDTDDYVYSRNGLIYECKIDSTYNSVKCTKNNSKYEHPFEYMAYTLSESC